MNFIWPILGVLFIAILAIAIHKGKKGTPFVNNCGCTPNIDHLKWVEKGEAKDAANRENLW